MTAYTQSSMELENDSVKNFLERKKKMKRENEEKDKDLEDRFRSFHIDLENF